jgi:hypothetical protein
MPVNTASEEGYTALHYASYHGNAAAVHALLVAGADQRLRNSKGETPYTSAKVGGHKHVGEVLRAWAAASAEEGEVVEYDRAMLEPSGKLNTTDDAEPISDASRSWVANQRVAASWLLIEISGAKGVGSGTVVALNKQRGGETVEMVVGRSRSQDLVLRDLEVSTRHAKLGLGGACITSACLIFARRWMLSGDWFLIAVFLLSWCSWQLRAVGDGSWFE